MSWLGDALHDLCQPLTALECGLYLGTMSPERGRTPTADELMTTINHALTQCKRLTVGLRAIKDRMNREE
jgi:hypothetical protein